MHFRYPVSFLAGKYDRDRFYEMAKGLEEVKEGGSRCMGCYELRLKESAEIAVAGGFDYFTTTLSISPMKNAQKLNEIGQRVGEEYGVQYSICFLISRRRTDIRDPSNCLESMAFIVRIIVDVSSPIKRVRQKNVCEMSEEAIKIAENKKKSTEFVEIRYILQVYSRHLTL